MTLPVLAWNHINHDYKIFRIKVHKTTRMLCLMKNGLRCVFMQRVTIQLRWSSAAQDVDKSRVVDLWGFDVSIFYKEQIKSKARGMPACRHYEDEKKLWGLRLRHCNDCHRIHMEIYAVSKWLGRGRPSSVPHIHLPGQNAEQWWVVET